MPEPTPPPTSGPVAPERERAAHPAPEKEPEVTTGGPEPPPSRHEYASLREADPPVPFVPTAPSGLSRLMRALRAKPDLGQVAVGSLVGLLGFAAALQIQADDDDLLTRARRADLVQILDGLTERGDRLESQIAELEADRRDLISGADSDQAALEQATTRAQQLAVLAGTAAASGPGIIVTVTDPDVGVDALTLLSAVQEMRDAGAEAIEVAGAGDTQVRVVASSYFLDSGDGVEVDGVELRPPYRFTAIGEPETLASAMQFPQGVVSRITDKGGRATVSQEDALTVDALHEAAPHEYASPAPDDDAG